MIKTIHQHNLPRCLILLFVLWVFFFFRRMVEKFITTVYYCSRKRWAWTVYRKQKSFESKPYNTWISKRQRIIDTQTHHRRIHLHTIVHSVFQHKIQRRLHKNPAYTDTTNNNNNNIKKHDRIKKKTVIWKWSRVIMICAPMINSALDQNCVAIGAPIWGDLTSVWTMQNVDMRRNKHWFFQHHLTLDLQCQCVKFFKSIDRICTLQSWDSFKR